MHLLQRPPARSAANNVEMVLMQAPQADQPGGVGSPSSRAGGAMGWAGRRVGFDHITAMHDILVEG
eukprot:339082-Prorocentrum_minimum.AAC.1